MVALRRSSDTRIRGNCSVWTSRYHSKQLLQRTRIWTRDNSQAALIPPTHPHKPVPRPLGSHRTLLWPHVQVASGRWHCPGLQGTAALGKGPHGSVCHSPLGPTGVGMQEGTAARRQLSVTAQSTATSAASARLRAAAETVLPTPTLSFYFHLGARKNRLLIVLPVWGRPADLGQAGFFFFFGQTYLKTWNCKTWYMELCKILQLENNLWNVLECEQHFSVENLYGSYTVPSITVL